MLVHPIASCCPKSHRATLHSTEGCCLLLPLNLLLANFELLLSSHTIRTACSPPIFSKSSYSNHVTCQDTWNYIKQQSWRWKQFDSCILREQSRSMGNKPTVPREVGACVTSHFRPGPSPRVLFATIAPSGRFLSSGQPTDIGNASPLQC